jgi:DNA primase
MSAAHKLLDRLPKAKQTGQDRWVACCPAHDDKSPSLSIRDVGDRLLIHCFGGCRIDDVLAALGMSFGALFDGPLMHHASPTQSRIPARDLLELIAEEATLVAIIGADMLAKKRISDEDWKRLSVAAARIHRARDHAYGR